MAKAWKKRGPRPKRSHRRDSDKRWVSRVKTVSTFPPEGTFNKDAKSIAWIMASKKVSPKGIGSGIKMIQYFINRGGKGLSVTRRKELEKAKKILQQKAASQRKKTD
jgi:tRNA(adenine34) deaminase